MTVAELRRASPAVGALARFNPTYLLAGLITLILVVGEWRYGILGSYWRLVLALGTCVVTELVLSKAVRGRFANVLSAYVSGNSLAILLWPQAGLLWPFALGGFIAIASKYVITYHNRHLWNPSNFAIGVLVLLAPGSVAILSHQVGNELVTNAIIWAIGLIVVWRAKVLHITVTYVLSFLAFAVVRHWIVGGPLMAEIAPLTGPMYQLLVFFMITDPRTTVSTPRGRILVAFLIAFVEMLIRLAADFQVSGLGPLYYAPPILALFFVGPAAMVMDLRRKAAAAHRQQSAN